MKIQAQAAPIALPVRNVGTINTPGKLEAFLLAVAIEEARPQAEAAGAMRARLVVSQTHEGLGVRPW